jgi:ABC-type sugar transport system substrate-binding protein
VTSARANRSSGLRLQPVDPTPLRPALRVAMDADGVPVVAPLSFEAEEHLVLTVLVERFGGEVTGAALTLYLTQMSGRTQSALGPGLIDVLPTLHRIGALSLEANGENDFIVRLLPDGAKLCV